MKKTMYRIYQKILHLFTYLMPIPKPTVYRGLNSYENLTKILNINSKVLIVTDKFLDNHETTIKIKELLNSNQIKYLVFDGAKPDPTIDDINYATKVYIDNQCNKIVAIGGGSAIDLAKGVGIKIARPNKKLTQLAGILKVRKKLPTLIAIPTTVGTGSEATLACVVTDDDSKRKFAIMDHKIVPKYAILEYSYVYGLPKHLIAHTAMDALTHALEAYIGNSTTKKTKKESLAAINIIVKHIILAYEGNHDSLEQLLEASYLAGRAFTRSYVGNIHAIAHTFGGFYKVEHGLANAVIMPHVLDYYGVKIDKKLSVIYNYLGYKGLTNNHDKSRFMNDKIKELNESLNIPTHFNIVIKDSDLPLMINNAIKEANPLYPVPVIFNEDDFKNIYKKITKGDDLQ